MPNKQIQRDYMGDTCLSRTQARAIGQRNNLLCPLFTDVYEPVPLLKPVSGPPTVILRIQDSKIPVI